MNIQRKSKCWNYYYERTEHFRYDALGRPVWKKDRDGNETTTAYTRTGQTAGIRYADGTTVEMQYDALDRLTKVKDSLGTTSIKRDRTGRITAVTDLNGQTVSYEWEKTGQRRRTTYPDGQQTAYTYDSLQRLTAMHIRKQEDGTQHDRNSAEDPQTITYRYDPEGRLTEKTLPGGIRTTWQYDREDGLPVSLTHTDKNGVLDHYTYAYDPMGNKTAVTRQRRGLPRESGAYTYTYDPIGRLTAVAKDGTPLRDYAYDPYSNRAHMRDHHKGSATAYTYDAADRLTRTQTWEIRTDPVQQRTDSPMPDTITAPLTQPALTRTYEYDHRGNLTKELQEGIPVHSYAYNAMDRLEKAWSHTPDGAIQTETAYHYNGLGQRVGKSRYTAMPAQTAGERTIQNLPQTQTLCQGRTMGQPTDSMTAAVHEDYLPDLTRPYHNLLSVTRNDGAPAQTFYWDGNAAAMEENGRLHYYLQDEMGSPVRVSGYDSTDTMADGDHDATDTYLTYGYDEFGNDLARTIGKELEEDGIPSPYTMQGEGQPLGYTGYRYDTDSATYFAQAREYQPQTGRFCAQDVVAGNGAVPVTLNRYGYCWGNPVGMVDLNGLTPEENTETAYVYYIDDFKRQANWQIKKLRRHGIDVVAVPINEEAQDRSSEEIEKEMHLANEFKEQWNDMPDQVDTVYIFSHGTEKMLQFQNGSGYNALTLSGLNKADEFTAGSLHDLEKKDISELYIQACNGGHIDALFDRSIGNENVASVLSNKIGDGIVYAWDGSVSFYLNGAPKISNKQGHFYDDLITNQGYPLREPLGQLMYQNGKPIDNQYYQERLSQISEQMDNILSDIWHIGEDTLQGCIS